MGLTSGVSDEFLEALYVGRWMTGQEVLAEANAERAKSGGKKKVPEGSLYPTLLRLEDDGLIEMETFEKTGRPGRPGRRYRITANGQRTVDASRAYAMAMGGAFS